MAKKILLVSPVLVCAAVITALALSGVGGAGQEATPAELEQQKVNIVSLLEAGDIAGAETALDEILALADTEQKGQVIHEVAGAYKEIKDFDKTLWLSQYVVDRWPGADYAVWCEMEVALCNIELGNNTAAQSAVEKLSADYANDANRPWTLYIVAQRYDWGKDYTESKELYERIIQVGPETLWGQKAALGKVRVEILETIASRGFDTASQEIDLMVGDFAGHADLPATVSRMADEYQWARKYEQAERLYRLSEELTESISAETEKSQLDIKKAEILVLINAGRDEEVLGAVNQLIIDFNDSTLPPEVLHWVGMHYEWLIQYEPARAVYGVIAEHFTGSEAALTAAGDITRLNTREQVMHKINFAGAAEARDAVENMLGVLGQDDASAGELLWVAREYDDSRKFTEAQWAYNLLIERFPDSAEAKTTELDLQKMGIVRDMGKDGAAVTDAKISELMSIYGQEPGLVEALHWLARKREDNMEFDAAEELYLLCEQLARDGPMLEQARIDSAKMSILPLIESGETAAAEEMLRGLIDEYGQSQYLAAALGRTGRQCLLKAWEAQTDGEGEQAGYYFEQALKVLEMIISESPTRTPDIVDAHYLAGVCYEALEDYERAISQFEAVVREYPGFRYADAAQLEIAHCRAAIWRRDTQGSFDVNDTAEMITAYEEFLSKYPESQLADAAKEELSDIEVASGGGE